MSLQLPAILSPPTPCIPSPALTVSPLEEVAEVALPFTGRRPVLGFAHPTQARQCIRPYRVQHCFIYGLAVRLRLPPTPPFDDAVSFDYGQPVFCPMGTSTPLLVRTLRRTPSAEVSASREETNRCSMAMAISSAKPMPTKPPVASVSPSRMSFTASAAETTLPFSSRLRNGRAGCSITGSSPRFRREIDRNDRD